MFCCRLWFTASATTPFTLRRLYRLDVVPIFLELQHRGHRPCSHVPATRTRRVKPPLCGRACPHPDPEVRLPRTGSSGASRPTADYFLGTSSALLSSTPAPPGSRAETQPPFYSALRAVLQHIRALPGNVNFREESPISLVGALTETMVPLTRRPSVSAFPWRAIAPDRLPGHLREFQRQRGWSILPTRERQARWGATRISSCPNCGFGCETIIHAVQQCVVARTF